MTTPLQLSHFLSKDKTAELELGLSQLAATSANNYMGVWCAETCFVVVVEVIGGRPAQWHIRGPLTQEGAKTWLGIVRAEIEAGAEVSRLKH
jgi:hypothetical protein